MLKIKANHTGGGITATLDKAVEGPYRITRVKDNGMVTIRRTARGGARHETINIRCIRPHTRTEAHVLMVMDSRLVIRVENMVTTSSFEVLGADLNGTMSNYMRLVLLILLSLLLVACLCRSYKRLRRKLLYM